jgi:hypothetical protein
MDPNNSMLHDNLSECYQASRLPTPRAVGASLEVSVRAEQVLSHSRFTFVKGFVPIQFGPSRSEIEKADTVRLGLRTPEDRRDQA